MATQGSRPTVVLVHGAWADATGFDAEIRACGAAGSPPSGSEPARDLAATPPIQPSSCALLAVRSCSSATRTAAMSSPPPPSDNDQVQALVYFNGWMCSEGESQQLLLEKFEGSLVGPSIQPVPFTYPDGSEGTDLYLAPEAFRDAFAADVDPATAAVMAAAQRPYAAAAFAATPSAPPAWNTLPCWYLLGTEDKAIPPELQRFMAERANATIVEVPASHVSFVSQPEAAHSADPDGESRRLPPRARGINSSRGRGGGVRNRPRAPRACRLRSARVRGALSADREGGLRPDHPGVSEGSLMSAARSGSLHSIRPEGSPRGERRGVLRGLLSRPDSEPLRTSLLDHG